MRMKGLIGERTMKNKKKVIPMQTVKSLSKQDDLDVVEYTKDIVASGIGGTAYGQTYADPSEAEKLKNKRVRESRSEAAKEFESPSIPISEVTAENSGVLDAQIARAEKILPEIKAEIKKIESQLEDSDLAPYQRGRLKKKLTDLRDRQIKHEGNIQVFIDRLNDLFEPGE